MVCVVIVGRWAGTARNCSIERMTVTLASVSPFAAASKSILLACTQTSSNKMLRVGIGIRTSMHLKPSTLVFLDYLFAFFELD